MPRNGSAAGSAQTGVGGALSRFSRRSYAVDHIALGCLVAGWVLIQLFAHPFHRMFILDNKSIQFPFAVVERVSVVWSIVYAGLCPLLIFILWAAMFRPGSHKVHVTVLGFFVTLILTSFLTDVIKNVVGRPRPDFISRCIPRKGTPGDILVAWTVCTQTNDHILQEGWRSFPSGHSSFSFAGLGYLAYFFSGQMHVFRPRADLGRCLLAFVPMLCALMVAISRLNDYRHDIYDVTCGSILGILVSYFSYRRYYPPLCSVKCDIPHDRKDADGFSRLAADEEQQLDDMEGETYRLGEQETSH
ncbi:phosphatase PAP2 family protein [Aspergillus chevalieri]|uniref:Phosphatidic acid phosphatase type 2/haloperoxidase domain-containing protein n=1 Tax=Aspergillus chevalieri TaxID=182096 RepID=A0A7R7ZTW1_ASPCH|nr:uncharacterized protein ACHE_80782A [Aspergillus chevalieri]BCR92882.1 hypothetical protein ACHE_80782A [Aspergillus chevalieri]